MRRKRGRGRFIRWIVQALGDAVVISGQARRYLWRSGWAADRGTASRGFGQATTVSLISGTGERIRRRELSDG